MKGAALVLAFSCQLSEATAQVTALFSAPDTVCVNQTFTIQNQSTGSITGNYWGFCMGNPNVAPTATNLGNIGSQLSYPVYYSIGKQGNDFYAFVTNNAAGTVVRLFYGTSLLHSPTVTPLGNLGGLPGHLEDMHLELEAGNWYGILVGGVPGGMYRLDFGNSLGNVPTLTTIGNIGGMNYPQRLQIFWSGGNCYGFTCNRNNSTLTRFSFGNSIANTPTAINLGNIGGLSTNDDLALINYNGNWHGYIVNEGNSTLTRLDFGNSLLNIPTGTNLGNTGALDLPRGIDVYVECNSIMGLVVNRNSNDLLKMNFSAGPTGALSTVSYGNIGNFSFPHSVERFRSGDTLFAVIPNVNNNTLSRIYYPGCTNASLPSSSLFNPPVVSYNATGTYYINYIANEGQITQAAYCRKVVVTDAPVLSTQNKTICAGSKATLTVSGATSYSWSTAQNTSSIQVTPSVTAVFTVTGSVTGSCKATRTVQVVVNACLGFSGELQNIRLSVFPNPARGEIHISSDADISVMLLNVMGQEIRRINFTGGDRSTTISDLEEGIYFLTAVQSKISQKIIVMKE